MRIMKKETSIIKTVLVVLICFSSSSESLKILGIFPLNAKSHFVMFERLMKNLAEKGHEVDVYSHYPLNKPVPNYKDFSLAGSLPLFVNNMSYQHITEFSDVNMEIMQKMLGEPVCNLMKNSVFQELFKSTKKYDVVIVEVMQCFF